MRYALAGLGGAAMLALAIPVAAQTPDEPPAPPPGWTGSFGAGLALTQGNRDTSTINVAYEIERDSGSSVLFKSTGLFLRGESQGQRTSNRLGLDTRVDREITERTSFFGQLQYLSDEFKQIDYLVSPTLGMSHQIVENDRVTVAVDAGAGMVWEKNLALVLKTDGAVTSGQNFSLKLSDTAEFSQKISTLWKMDDFDDGLYIFGLGLAANVTTRTQIKVEALNTFKSKPPVRAVQKNDVALLVSFVYKF